MIDKNKTYKTRDGREVEIYAIRRGGDFPVHGAVKVNEFGVWQSMSWAPGGSKDDVANQVCDLDLIEVKPRIKRTYWVNVHDNDFAPSIFPTKATADKYITEVRLACIKVEIDCAEGEGLNDD